MNKNIKLVSLSDLIEKHGRRYSQYLSMVADRTNDYSINGTLASAPSTGSVRGDLENPERYVPTIAVLVRGQATSNIVSGLNTNCMDTANALQVYFDCVLSKELPCLAAAIKLNNAIDGVASAASSVSGASDSIFGYIAPDVLLNRCIADKYPVLSCKVADIELCETVIPTDINFYLETDKFDAIISCQNYSPESFESVGVFDGALDLADSAIVDAIIIKKNCGDFVSMNFCSGMVNLLGESNTDSGFEYFDLVKSAITMYTQGKIALTNDSGIDEVLAKIDVAESPKKVSKLIRRLGNYRGKLKIKG